MPTAHDATRLSELDLAIVRAVPPGGNWRDVPATVRSRRIDGIRASYARGEGSRSTYYGRLRWDAPSYTISTYFNRPGNGCTIHPEADRMLTVREAARLQTFPDWFQFNGSARARHVQVGNAVPPLLAAQIAATLPATTAVDLFAGAGGMTLGLEAAGHRVVASVDHDRDALVTLSQLGHPVIREDLADPARRRALAARLGGVGLLAGGPPCQGFSTAGWCDPHDARNDLLGAFVDMAELLEPDAILIENVAALLWRGRGLLDLAIARLEAAGYRCQTALLHAEAYGVPQRRRRAFVIGRRDGEPEWPVPWRALAPPAYRRLQPHGGGALPAPYTVRDAIADLPLEPGADVGYAGPPTSPLQAWLRDEPGAKLLAA